MIIARDGTIYYSQSRAVGRLAPGGSPENGWVSLGGSAGTVWGMALDAANETLYVGSPSAGTIFSIDLTAATPTSEPFVTGAGAPNGLTIGPDGALYYSDFGGSRVMRVEASGGTPTRVTTTNIASANGVAFDADGTLLVCSYSSGTLFRLTLTAGAETARDTVATGLGSPDGVAVDANGDYWVTDNSGALVFVPAAGGTPMRRLMGVANAASVDFGAGPLNCEDIYIASGGQLRRYEETGVAGAAVPWH
jgi:sugar lactone lactonase YvrE